MSLEQRIAYWLGEAKRHYDAAVEDEETGLTLFWSSLRKAKLCGDYLNRAKQAVEEKGDDWLPVLDRTFGQEKIRSCQDLMQLARRWSEVEPELEKKPHLTKDDALRILRGKKPKAKESDEERLRKSAFSAARRILERAWKACKFSQAENEIVQQDLGWLRRGPIFDPFKASLAEAVKRLKRQVRLEAEKARTKDQKSEFNKRKRRFFSWDELECSEDWSSALRMNPHYLAGPRWPRRKVDLSAHNGHAARPEH